MKLLTMLFLSMTLTGCGVWDRLGVAFSGDASEVCYKGIMYVQFTSGASVAYNRDGTFMKGDC